MTDWKDYIDCKRGVLIAPAGHGKTTTIADCLLQCPTESRQLVLTHTHAGIASLREKFRKNNIPSSKYQLDTITGFAQRYVLSFLGTSALPNEENKDYFGIVIEKCHTLMLSKVIQTIVKASYDGIFVDEYQDCTIDQHNLILAIAEDLPLHLLGDPLQGIFSFENKPLVDFDKDLSDFTVFDTLKHPWRWNKTNPLLGQCILNIKEKLLANAPIELKNNPKADFYVIANSSTDDKYKCLRNIIRQHDCNSLLIVCPSYYERNKYGKLLPKGNLKDRIEIKQRIGYTNSFKILDAIDSKEYYKCAKDIDSLIEKIRKGSKIRMIAKLYTILKNLHLNLTEIKQWIDKDKNLIVHKKKENAALSATLIELFENFETDKTLNSLQNVITFIVGLPKIKCYHTNFYRSIDKSFDIARTNDISMLSAMQLLKTRERHQGRKIKGRCIGTTLLTKGLEFDTVVLWEAHKFADAKNFYVAISRACKKLIIMTDLNTFNFGG